MIIGNKKEFAVEYTIYNNKQYQYGTLHYWINNEKIGDDDYVILLNDLLILLFDIIRYNKFRINEKLFNKYNYSEFKKNLTYKIIPNFEAFKKWECYLIENKKQAKIMYREKNNPFSSFILNRNIVNMIIEECYNELNKMADEFDLSRFNECLSYINDDIHILSKNETNIIYVNLVKKFSMENIRQIDWKNTSFVLIDSIDINDLQNYFINCKDDIYLIWKNTNWPFIKINRQVMYKIVYLYDKFLDIDCNLFFFSLVDEYVMEINSPHVIIGWKI